MRSRATYGCERGASERRDSAGCTLVPTGIRRDRKISVPEHGGVPPGVMRVLAFHKEGAVLSLVAAPRAGSTEFGGLEGERLRVRVAAAPVDGTANEALIRFLARALGVPRSRIKVLSGETGCRKRLLFVGMSHEELGQRLKAAGVSP